jgi:hypothetical protein
MVVFLLDLKDVVCAEPTLSAASRDAMRFGCVPDSPRQAD